MGLMRHLILSVLVLGFVSVQTDRLRGGNAEVTLEQVCVALNRRCGELLVRRRGVSARQQVGVVIRYHQVRNAAARKSRKKRQHNLIKAL